MLVIFFSEFQVETSNKNSQPEVLIQTQAETFGWFKNEKTWDAQPEM